MLHLLANGFDFEAFSTREYIELELPRFGSLSSVDPALQKGGMKLLQKIARISAPFFPVTLRISSQNESVANILVRPHTLAMLFMVHPIIKMSHCGKWDRSNYSEIGLVR